MPPIVAGDMQDGIERAVALLRATYHVPYADIRVVCAPYRICPLGAHVDHQYGQVAACAIDHAVFLAFAPRLGPQMDIVSDEFGESVSIATDVESRPVDDCWANHARGAVAAMSGMRKLRDGFVGATVGGRSQAGLSSSAAVGVAYLMALAHSNDIELSPDELVRLDEQIETGFLGLKNGVLDPAAIVYGKAHSLTSIDTRNCSFEHFTAPAPMKFVAYHSGVSAPLTPANFNRRVEESLRAAELLSAAADLQLDQPRLGDIGDEVYAAFADALPALEARRAKHFFGETRRVRAALEAWRAGDAAALGDLIRASAQSSIENYECGATPVKDLLAILNTTPGVYGARFCGPGFRGCCVALIEHDAMEDLVARAASRYARLHPQLARRSWVLECELADGAGMVS